MRSRRSGEGSRAGSRRSLLRGIFLTVIILTLPFYCLGFALWALGPDPRAPEPTTTLLPAGEEPSFTPRPIIRATFTSEAITQPTIAQQASFTPRSLRNPTLPSGFPTSITVIAPPVIVATNAPFVRDTPTATNTLPPLLPPSDTPGP